MKHVLTVGLVTLSLGLPLLSAPPIAAATSSLRVSATDPVAGEVVNISGRLRTGVRRTVVLQYRSESRWRTIGSGSTGRTGRFSFAVRAHTPRQYRVIASKLVRIVDGRRVVHPAQTTPSIRITPVKQSAALAFVPAPIGQSTSGRQNLIPATARFSPARSGRPVLVQRRSGGSWETVATGAQDRSGWFTFHVPAKAARSRGAYRAIAAAHNGADAKATPATRASSSPRIWSEEFDSGSLDLARWGYRQLGRRYGQRMCAQSSDRMVSVADGVARLTVEKMHESETGYDAAPGACPYGQFHNAHLGTEATFKFRYGIVAARIKFPSEDGQHGALWLQPTPVTGSTSGAEIDVVEHFGDDFRNGVVQHSVYWTAEDGTIRSAGGYHNLNRLLGRGKTWSNSFHVFSVEWTPEAYIFRVDGNETFRTSEGLSHADQYLILSLLTSDWELPRMDPSKLGPMEVDWVRVWAGASAQQG